MLHTEPFERRAAQRHKVVLPALCWNATRPDFYAVTYDVSTLGICFRSAVVPSVEEALTCSIRHVGQVTGIVTRAGTDTFMVRVQTRTRSAGSIAKDLLALARQQEPDEAPARAHRRVVPHHTQVAVERVCGRTMPGRLLNVSASGAAFVLDEPVEIGTLLKIGGTWARVARNFEGGVGAMFLEPLDPRDVSEHIRL